MDLWRLWVYKYARGWLRVNTYYAQIHEPLLESIIYGSMSSMMTLLIVFLPFLLIGLHSSQTEESELIKSVYICSTKCGNDLQIVCSRYVTLIMAMKPESK